MMTEQSGSGNSRQRAVLVLGAGRSGTSLTARALQAVGVDLGNNFKPASRKNPSGFFEDRALLALSKRLRRSLSLRPDSLRLLDDSVWSSPAVNHFLDPFEQTIRAQFGQSRIWGFKYARTMRLLPFWMRLFERMNIEANFLMPIRNPLSVARSREKLDKNRGAQEHSDLEWLVNVVPYFPLVKGHRLVVIDYDQLLTAPMDQLNRIAAGLALEVDETVESEKRNFCENFIRSGLRHSQFTVEELRQSDRINPMIKSAYPWLDRLAKDETDSSNETLWQAWASIHEQLRQLDPILERMDELAKQLRHAQFNPLSPISAIRTEISKFLAKR
jgi:hypothetical protein